MENSNPIEQMKGFAEKKLRVLRENPDESGTKAYLAKMRKGVGKVPGADPELWGILFEDLPEELIGRGNTPGRAELALYTAFTLYAIHQQSRSLKDENAHQRGIGFGRAAGEMAAQDPESLKAAYERNGAVIQAEGDPSGLCAVSSGFLSVSGFGKNSGDPVKMGTRFLQIL